MTRRYLGVCQGAVMMVVLCMLAALAPMVNADAGPPASVFARWPEQRPVPLVHLTPARYPDGSWYVDLRADGFVFSAICQTVNGPQTIGHAHVYSGERKVAAAYTPRVDLGHLRPGRHSFRAVLRAQDHRALVGPKGLLAGTVVIDVPRG